LDLTLRTIKEAKRDQLGTMEIDPNEPTSSMTPKEKLEQILAIPATLYMPAAIVDRLKQISAAYGYSPWQLIVYALKLQIDHWEEFYRYVTTPKKEVDDFVWLDDPLFCLACATTAHFINSSSQCSQDPEAIQRLKEDAPAEWSFSSLEEIHEDPADWWKTGS
jgi:hypothetical protein